MTGAEAFRFGIPGRDAYIRPMPRKPIELPPAASCRLQSLLTRLPYLMRTLALAVLATGIVFAPASTRAQTYGTGFPFCLQSCALGGCKIECDYTSLAQCNAAASGRAAQCLTNPFFEHPTRKRVDRMGYR